MLDTETILPAIQPHLPDADAPPRFEPIPTGHFNDSWFVTADGQQFVLRVAPSDTTPMLFYERGMMKQEPALHALLRNRTEVPVPRVIAFDDSRQVIDRDWLLLERLPGRPLSAARGVDPAPILEHVGRCLADVHAIHATQYGYLGEHRPMPARSCWADAFEVMWSKLIDDIEATGQYNATEAETVRGLVGRYRSTFDRPVRASLLHMDVWAQNILVDEAGRLCGLLDWDRALWGDVEIEFAVLDYCGISTPDFWRGYGTGEDPRRGDEAAAARRVFYLLYELQKYIVIEHARRRNGTGAAAYRDQALAIMEQRLL